MCKHIKKETIGNVGVITLHRPEKLNAWHRPMRDEIFEALDAYENDDQIRAIILTGSGDRGFCAGQDFNESRHFDPDMAEAWIEEFRRLYGRILSLTKPLIAALNGVAAGSGFQVALLADIRIAHPGVTMGQPEINSGIASITGPWIMREMLGLSRTVELTLTGRLMSADECYRAGIIHTIVPQEDLFDGALEMAKALASKAPTAMGAIKRRFCEMTSAGFDDAFEAAIRFHRETYASGDPQQRMEDFLKKKRVD